MLNATIPSVIMPNVIMPIVTMLSVIMLTVIVLNVIALWKAMLKAGVHGRSGLKLVFVAFGHFCG
jgi:hypothetical protein